MAEIANIQIIALPLFSLLFTGNKGGGRGLSIANVVVDVRGVVGNLENARMTSHKRG